MARPEAAARAEVFTRRKTLRHRASALVALRGRDGDGVDRDPAVPFSNVPFEPPTRFRAALGAACARPVCMPNWLPSQNKFKGPRHGSGYDVSQVDFEGPTPRPLGRGSIVISPEDGLVVVDKAVGHVYERGRWADPNAFIKPG